MWFPNEIAKYQISVGRRENFPVQEDWISDRINFTQFPGLHFLLKNIDIDLKYIQL